MRYGLELVVLFVNWNIITTSFVVDVKTFKPLLFHSGAAACAIDSPKAVIPLSELQIALHDYYLNFEYDKWMCDFLNPRDNCGKKRPGIESEHEML